MKAVNSLASIRVRYQASTAIAIITAGIFGMAGAVQAAEVRHEEGEWLKPSGKGWGELDPSGETARNAQKLAKRQKANGINYYGGPVMLGTPNIYYIWYGTWVNTAQTILRDLASTLNSSPWENINTTYFDGTGAHVTGSVTFKGETTDNYSQGTALSDAQIQTIVSNALTLGGLPTDTNGIYFVLTSADVNETSGFCTQYCGWHTHGTIAGNDIKYAFVGNAARCPAACTNGTAPPNGDVGADGMASIIAHEQVEAVSDPDLNAWYDQRGQENADKCAWTFGTTYTTSNGGVANMRLGARDFLIQQNWVNASGGYCAKSYP